MIRFLQPAFGDTLALTAFHWLTVLSPGKHSLPAGERCVCVCVSVKDVIKDSLRDLRWRIQSLHRVELRDGKQGASGGRESRWGHHGFKLSLRDYAPPDGVTTWRGLVLSAPSATGNPAFLLPHPMGGWAWWGLKAKRDEAWIRDMDCRFRRSKGGLDGMMEDLCSTGPELCFGGTLLNFVGLTQC